MRVIVPTLVGLAALSAVSAQAAPNSSNWHETPAQNVWRSQQYDHLLRTDTNFRHYRMNKEWCRRDLCWNSFGAVSGWMRILDQAARSIGLSASFWFRVCHPSTLRMVI